MGRDARVLAKQELAARITMVEEQREREAAEFAAFVASMEEFHYCADHDCGDHGNWAEAEGSGDTGEAGPFFTGYKGRSVKKGQKVKVYRNLHKEGVVYSIRDAKTGQVLGHSPSVMLENVDYEVHEAGRQRVIREKKKNVHSFVSGEYAGPYSAAERKAAVVGEPVSYNPYKSGSYYSKVDERAVSGADKVIVDQTGVFMTGERKKQLRASASLEEFYNQCNSEEDGRFCEGDDGPGRVRDEGTPREGADLGKKGLVTTKYKSKRIQKKADEINNAKGLSMLSEEEFDHAISVMEKVEERKESVWTKLRKLFTTKKQEAKWEARQQKIDQHKAEIRKSLDNIKKDRASKKEVDRIKDDLKRLEKEQDQFEKDVDRLAEEEKRDQAYIKKQAEEQEQVIKDEAVYASASASASATMVRVTGPLSREVEFYNRCNDPETGNFCEGPDGPGRVRDEGTEDLGKPGYVSGSESKSPSKPGTVTKDNIKDSKQLVDQDEAWEAAKRKAPSASDVKKAPPSAKTVRDINKGLSGTGVGDYPDWTKYPGAPKDTSGENWNNFLQTEGGKKFLADVEKFEGEKTCKKGYTMVDGKCVKAGKDSGTVEPKGEGKEWKQSHLK